MKQLVFLFFTVQILFGQEQMKPEDTEVWEPEPELVQPGTLSPPPSGLSFGTWRRRLIFL